MSTAFSRLREVFLDDRDPQQALFCTYGLDAEFFEAEVLPAVFPQRLALDRQAGSAAGYLNAADRALQSVPVSVFYDHLLGDGNQLQYVAQGVNVAGAFHAKLILLDYGDTLRAVISSANLTRPAWTQLLELFLLEDIIPGEPHPWAPGLASFLEHLAREVPSERQAEVRALSNRLAGDGPTAANARVLSSWDGPLLPRILGGLTAVDRIDVVTPFLEGDEGPGVFDRLENFAARGRLFLGATEIDERYLVRGPEQKIDALLDTGRWQMLRVHHQWQGDDEEAILRTLHGKALFLASGKQARVVTGSANVTRAALIVPPPAGNVELVVVVDTDASAARGLLPQASPVARDDVDIEPIGDPTGEDDPADEGAERWVESALYWANRLELELRLAEGAPQLKVRYDGHQIGITEGRHTVLGLQVRGPLYVEVESPDQVGLVPMIVADPAQFVPRGTPADLDDETFFLLLAGVREIEPVPGELAPAPDRTGEAGGPDGFGGRGAIPWRRILAAIQGVGNELEREGPFPRGVAFVLENETRLGGLRRRLRLAHERNRLLDADYAYALHELIRALIETENGLAEHPESRDTVGAVRHDLSRELSDLVTGFDGALADQLQILGREIAA